MQQPSPEVKAATKAEHIKNQELTPPAPTTQPQSKSCEAYRSLVAQYDWDAGVMLAIMKAESSCNPGAVGDDYPIAGVHAPSCGLLQVRTLPGRPDCISLKDPATNIRTAYLIFKSQGYRAWSVYSNGRYAKYL